MKRLADSLAAYAIGALDADDAATVERELATDHALAAELAELEASAAALCDTLVPREPDQAVRARLMASTVGRFARFAARFAELFDVSIERARDLLAMATSPSAWEPGPTPGSWLLHFTAGPAYAAADSGFVKLDPGMSFPWHQHRGTEQGLVLMGQAIDTMAGTLVPGDEPGADAETAHDFRAVGEEPFILAVRVFGVDLDAPRPPSQSK
jgi:hypothetical protein